MAKDESRNELNVPVRLYLGKLSLEGASVPHVHAPYNFIVNGFEFAAEHFLNKCHLLNLT